MKIRLKKSESHWVDLLDDKKPTGVKIKVDYPTLEQQDELDELYTEAMGEALKYAGELRKGNPDMGTDEINLESAKYINVRKFNQVKRLTIRYALKDIDGSDEPLKVVDNMIDKDQWENICQDRVLVNLLYSNIQEQISFTDIDKKK